MFTVISFAGMFYTSVVGVFSSFENAIKGIEAYENALITRNPHFKKVPSLALESLRVIEPATIGNRDELDECARGWTTRGNGTKGYAIVECTLDPRLIQV